MYKKYFTASLTDLEGLDNVVDLLVDGVEAGVRGRGESCTQVVIVFFSHFICPFNISIRNPLQEYSEFR